MKANILAVVLLASMLSGCTLSLSDKNPKASSILGLAGTVSGSIAGGNLTLTGTNLNNVTAMSLTQNGSPTVQLGPFVTRTSALLTVKLPSILRLPGMLLVSTPAGAQPVELSSLDALSVDGTLSVSGTTDTGFEKVQNTCVMTTGVCLATCPGTKKVVSGGCALNVSSVGLSANYPPSDSQWECQPTAAATINVYVICGRIALTY